jgi:membrane fusion protein (multidrug efflux system)
MRIDPRLLFALATVAAACSRHQPAAQPHTMPPVLVTTTTVVARDLPAVLQYLGRTEGSRDVEIRARVEGFLERRHFVEGSDVAAGDLLFELDARPMQAQQATAAADVATAEARVEQAAREAKRLRPLVAEQAVSEREADDADALERIARAQLAAARAGLQQIEVDLGYTRVTAPIAGRIGRALRTEGSLVTPGDGLLTTLLQLDPIYARFQRSERQQRELDDALQSGRLRLADGGFTVELRHRDGTLLLDNGRIDFTDGRLDAATGTIPMRASLPNAGSKVLAGQAVTVVLRGAVRPGAIAVPQRAVLEGASGKQVMVVADGEGGSLVAVAKPIEVGEWIDLPGEGLEARQWIVTKGLQPGDRVILDNLMKLMPGSAITLATTTAPTPAENR